MYLIEALKYNVQAFHEDRLTQVVAATFNESKGFQRIFLKFLHVPYLANLTAKTQVSNEAAPSRPDLIVYRNDVPYVLIESKIGVQSTKSQQQYHERIKASYYFLIARDPVFESRKSSRFTKVAWYDFFSFLLKYDTSRMSTIDIFLLQKLINFGKECKMLMPDKISKTDFEMASKFFTQVRLQENPWCLFDKKNPFQSLDTISLFLERVLIKVKDDKLIGKKLCPFRRRLGISSIYFEPTKLKIEKIRNAEERRVLNIKSESIIIDKEIQLKKPINNFHHLYVRAVFEPYLDEKEIIDMKFGEILKTNLRKISYKCRIVAGVTSSDRVFFDTVVCKDLKDLDFIKFYQRVVRAWERKIR